MRKEGISVKTASKGVLVTLLFFLFTLLISLNNKVFADVCSEASSYQFGVQSSCTVKEMEPTVSLNRTGVDIPNIISTEFVSMIWANSSQDERGTCGSCILIDQMDSANFRSAGIEAAQTLSRMYTQDDIEHLRNVCPSLDCEYNSTELDAKANGSIMGVTKMASNTVLSEPVPVNLAYYFKHNIKKIPIVNQTAYAQTASYNAFGMEYILGIWETTRNIAYAMMSVIMLVVGILIITQKKINPQTVVTVQSALPKIAIGLFLITFSYPIGAILASMIMPLNAMAVGFFVQQGVENFANMNLLVTLTTLITMLTGPQGIIGNLSGTLAGLLSVILMLIALVKVVVVQLKILVQIMLAPIQFAASSIPGQEHLISDWFKSMIAKVLAVPAIMFMIGLAWYWPNAYLTNPNNFSGIIGGEGVFVAIFTFLRSVSSTTLTPVMVSMLQMITLFMAVKADKKVEAFIIGDKKRK